MLLLNIVSSSNRLCGQCLSHLTRALSSQHYQLLEVGRLDSPQASGYYPAGQLFLHKVFGYRGVLLFPWTTSLYDRDKHDNKTKSGASWEEAGLLYDHIKGLRPDSTPYYQALIDNKDLPFIRSHPEAITFLASSSDTSLYTLPGLDYVCQEDILPYTPTSAELFSHELFSQFFIPASEEQGVAYTPRDVLSAWREKNHRWLSLSEVHRETTNGVRVTVMPFYMGRRDEGQSPIYWWRYNIRLECLSGETLTLRERHWRIYSLSGTLETVKGRGVVGQEPVFTTAQPAFQYSSHVSLQSASGHMWGTFTMERADKTVFEIRVPPFTLDSHETAL